ncbi:DUF5687 family protein [uncultured Kriegella sp.]|uniref:DUF5687 family protein n=1 Tax=uncultured Kriegella sp. TaxID=1798910 RepID=UPI0030D87C0B
MFKHFLRLQWKSFFRSSSLGKGLALKLLMIFFGIYMLVTLIGLGAGLYFLLEKIDPGVDPMVKLSQVLIYWLLFEFFVRYFMQKLPILDVKPLLLLPIKKSTITHYVLGRSIFSFYNVLALFVFIPFGFVLMANGYPVLLVLFWFLSILSLVLMVNFVNFIINKSDKALFGLIIIMGMLRVFEYFDWLPISQYAGEVFYTLYENPALAMFPFLFAVIGYCVNYRFLRNRIFLDVSLKKKTKEAVSTNMIWTKRFGSIAPFLQLDLKLIWRNKRTKMQVFLSLAMVLYGLIFYTMEDFGPQSPMLVFVGIFMTGIFLMNFGQFIPAWDSAYYSMMMSQNIPLRKYLESKAGLISVSVVGMFLLSVPYVYFGWEALAINFSSALYNLGVNIPIILFFGSMNKKRIDLTRSALGNMQGTGAAQLLVGIPLFGAPMLIYSVLTFLVSFEAAMIVLSILGIAGFVLRKPLLDKITNVYRKKKYGMIAGFKEKET